MVNFDDPLPPPPGLLKSYQAIDLKKLTRL